MGRHKYNPTTNQQLYCFRFFCVAKNTHQSPSLAECQTTMTKAKARAIVPKRWLHKPICLSISQSAGPPPLSSLSVGKQSQCDAPRFVLFLFFTLSMSGPHLVSRNNRGRKHDLLYRNTSSKKACMAGTTLLLSSVIFLLSVSYHELRPFTLQCAVWHDQGWPFFSPQTDNPSFDFLPPCTL